MQTKHNAPPYPSLHCSSGFVNIVPFVSDLLLGHWPGGQHRWFANFCQSTSKVQLRSLNNWRRCHAPDEETTKEANQACRILSTDRQICEMCLHRRGISLNLKHPF